MTSPKELEIEKRLSTPVSLKFQQRPLSEVVNYLGKIAQVPVYLDPEGLRAEGVASDTPVTIDLSQDISLKSALKLILEPLRLAYRDVIKETVREVVMQIDADPLDVIRQRRQRRCRKQILQRDLEM